MTDTTAALLFAALIWKMTDFVKHCTNRDTSAIVTQLAAWAIGFGAVVLFAHSSLSAHLVIDGIALAHAPLADQLLVGVTVGSFGSAGYDLKRALDVNDTAATPPMIPGPAAASPAAGPELPAQPQADPSVIASDEPPAGAPDPPGGYARAQQAGIPVSLGQADPPPFLDTPTGRATVRAATRASAPKTVRGKR